MEFFTKFPVMERSALAEFRKSIDFAFRDFSRAYGDGIESFFDPLLYFLVWLEKLMMNSPWPIIIGIICGLAWLASKSWKLVLGAAISFFLIGYFGMWKDCMATVAIITVGVIICMAVGIPVGILMARFAFAMVITLYERSLPSIEPTEPLNEEEEEKALAILDKLKVYKPDNAGQQVMVGEELGKELRDETAEPIRLIIIDSMTSEFRMDFSGRGELGERQQLLKKHIKHVSRIAEIYNVAVLITNQVMVSPSVMFGDPVKPIGGTTLGHTSTHRIYLRKGGKDKIVAKLVDSPNNAQNEAVLSLTRSGVENGE